jgi:hypothetical protein
MEYLLINECQSQSARGTQIAMTCVQVGHRVQSTLHRARSTLHAACRVQLINGFGYTLPCYFVVSGRQSPNAFGQKLGEIVAGPIAIVQTSSGVAGASTSALRTTTTARRSSARRGSTRSTWSAVKLTRRTLVLFAV